MKNFTQELKPVYNEKQTIINLDRKKFLMTDLKARKILEGFPPFTITQKIQTITPIF